MNSSKGPRTRQLRGIIPSIPTVCKNSGDLDEEGQRSVVRFCIEGGADGIACLLFAGEFYKFSDSERRKVARVVVDETNGRVPSLIGISYSGTKPSIELGKHAKDIGADCVIATPPYHGNFVAESQLSLVRHYEAIAKNLDIPIMIQDYETPGGVRLTVKEIDLISKREDNIRYVKVEGKDHLERIRNAIELTEGRVGVFGGMAGYHILEEMRLGVRGSIPGAEVVGQLVEIFQAAERKDYSLAKKRFLAVKPYLDFLIRHFESFVSVEKEALKAQGVIRSSAARDPLVPLDAKTRTELASLLRSIGVT